MGARDDFCLVWKRGDFGDHWGKYKIKNRVLTLDEVKNLTKNIVKNFIGKIVYINDDPDLLDNLKMINYKVDIILFSHSFGCIKMRDF